MSEMDRRKFFRWAGGCGLAAGLAAESLPGFGGASAPGPLAASLNYKVGMGQMLVEGGAVKANLARAVAMVRKAAARGCGIVLLPECLDCGWTFPESTGLARPIPGPYSGILADAARDEQIYIVAGLTERDGKDIYNTAVLISPQGEILLKHRKINVLTIAQDIYAIGDRLGVVHTPLGTIGVNICADNFSNSLVLAHSLARMGAQIILSPSAWAVDADHDNRKDPYGGGWRTSYELLAKLYDITVISVSNVGWITGGVWKGRKCIGCSMAVGPDGRTLVDGPYGEAAESLDIVDVGLLPRKVKGTAIAAMLKEKGYENP